MKKVVLFDFFGVISSEIAPIWFRQYYEEAEAIAIKAEISTKGDLGIISETEMFSIISERTNIPAEQIKQDWYALVKINTWLVDFIKKVKTKYPVYLLSNAVAPFLRRILEENNLYELFDRVFISSEMQLAKPDPKYFQTVLHTLGVSASDAVMIDDNAKNLAGAWEAGIDGIIFESNEQFACDFEKFFEI